MRAPWFSMVAIFTAVLPVLNSTRALAAPVDARSEASLSSKTRPPSRSEADRLVRYSRALFEGDCACPDDVGKDGTMCGTHSFYARNGSRGLLFCYASDVTADAIKIYRLNP